MPHVLEILSRKNGMNVFSFPKLVPPGSEEVEPSKANGRNHIALRPANGPVKRGWEGRQSELDDVIDKARRRGAG